MSSLNKVILIGRLGDDPEVRYTQSNTAVANISLATSEKYKDKSGEMKEDTEWHRIILWSKLAETAQEYLKKGSQVCFEGKLQTRSWEDKEGQTKYTTEIVAYSMVMLGSKGSNGGGNRPPHPADNAPKQQSQPDNRNLNEEFDDIDDDLPF